MKNYHLPIWLILFLIPAWGYGQSQNFEDGFGDGNFIADPPWNGDDSQYSIVDGQPNNLMQLQGDHINGDVSYLSSPSTDSLGSWEFFVRLDFSPSDGNKAEIFLMSDIANLEGPVNGYALRAGESGSDDVFRIVRYDNGTEGATVLSGTTDISEGGAFRVKVQRQSRGIWTLEVAGEYGGILSPEGNPQKDATYNSTNYFGVRSTYTSSRADLFYYDFKIDLPPLTITDATAHNESIEVTFNRAFDQNTVQNADFSVDKGVGGSPSSITFTSARKAILLYNEAFKSDQYVLGAENIQDLQGNNIKNNTSISFVVFGTAAANDIVLNEFMYDPPAGQAEYIEIKNTSEKFLNLQHWQLGDDSNTQQLSTDTLVIAPNNFLIVSGDTTALASTFGNRPYVQADLPSLNNTGDAIRLLTANSVPTDSLYYIPSWGGTAVSLERRSTTVPETYRENWGSSPAINGGTPGIENKVREDTKPPELDEINILSDLKLQLLFDERLDSSARVSGHYSIDGIGINSVTYTAPDTVYLTLNSALQNAEKYPLTISDISDIFGNTSSSTDTTFTYFKVLPADSGQVFINEFSYNPASGHTEYIEIYNPTKHTFDLQGWTLSDNRSNTNTITGTSTILPPNNYLVLAPDNTLLQKYPDISLIAMGSTFPALNNSGDDIVLKNNSGNLIDSLRFTSAWGGEEIPLERRTTNISGTFKENWGNALNNSGSAGAQNNIAKDREAPELTSLTIESASKLQLIFSEQLTAPSATAQSNFQISPGRSIRLISMHSDSVRLFLDKPLISEQHYTLTFSNISDIFGNQSAETQHDLEYLQMGKAQDGDIIINEIMADPGPQSAEFVELYNRSNKNIDISGWFFADANSKVSFPANQLLKSGQYLILTGSSTLAQSHKNAVLISGFPNLNNTEETLTLYDLSNHPIDSLSYTSRWLARDNSISLERKDPQAASNDPTNWSTNHTEQGNSAGIQNKAFQKDGTPPDVLFAKVRADQHIEVYFNEFIRNNKKLQFLMDGTLLKKQAFNPFNGNRMILESPEILAQTQMITIQNTIDVRGNKTASMEIPLARPLAKGDLVINEIMYHPLDDSDDNKPDQTEYVELYNTREYPLSLEGLVMHDAPDEDGAIRELYPVSTNAKWVRPKKTVLIYPDQAPTFRRSKLASFFELDSVVTSSLMRIEHSSLSLASTDDAIFIADSTGMTIDSVYYSETWQNPNLIDHHGRSLERITPGGKSNSPANWGSSVHSKGGTPHAQNSLYQRQPEQQQNIGISFTPNPFSPDGDGHEDHLVISYKLDQADYLLKVDVFDRYGRHIKELADGKPAGFEGSLIWDGRRDDGRRNRIGIYIIVFEAHNSSSGNDKAYKKTVVIARKLN